VQFVEGFAYPWLIIVTVTSGAIILERWWQAKRKPTAEEENHDGNEE